MLLKRGLSATMEEFLLADEYNPRPREPPGDPVRARDSHFETHTRFTLPLASVPYLKERTHCRS